jgi:glucosamine kinase
MDRSLLLLGVDGGGTRCRARLCDASREVLAEAETGPANLRLGVSRSFAAAIDAAQECLDRAGIPQRNLADIVACLALAGASEPGHLAAAQTHQHPFRHAMVTTDAHAACVGAHGNGDGGVIVAGTGTVGWAIVKGKTYRVGGWGLPLSDEGSGAWIGCEALRRVLWAADGRLLWTPLLEALFADFADDPHAIVAWAATASPREYGTFTTRIVDYATRGDAAAIQLMQSSAAHIDALAVRLVVLGANRLALSGGFAPTLRPWLAPATVPHLVEPAGDALTGALALASSTAAALTRVA